MLDMFIDTPYSKQSLESFEEDLDFDPDTYDADTYEKYLYYCHMTGGDPYSKEEWSKITGIKD